MPLFSPYPGQKRPASAPTQSINPTPSASFQSSSSQPNSQTYNPHVTPSAPQSQPQPQFQLMRVQIPAGLKPGQRMKVQVATGLMEVVIPSNTKWIYNTQGQPSFDFKIPMSAAKIPVVTATAVPVTATATAAANQVSTPPYNPGYVSNNHQGNKMSTHNTNNLTPWQSYDTFQTSGMYRALSLGMQDVSLNPNPIKPNGRFKALLIGINYTGTVAQLKGCVNDVNNIKILLMENGFPNDSSHMVQLTDDGKNKNNPNYLPTARSIRKGLQWLMKDVCPGDVLFFHFSGHGAQIPDKSGHETDGMNETILPLDYKNGQITDDELWGLLVRPLPSGVKLTSIMDCCHSGTGLDLPFEYNYKMKNASNSNNSNNLENLAQTAGKYLPGKYAKKVNKLTKKMEKMGVNPSKFLGGSRENECLLTPSGQWFEDVNPAHSKGDVVLFSGCKDSQTSADAANKFTGESNGAFTNAFISAYRSSCSTGRPSSLTYPEFLKTIHMKLKQKHFSQKPQLTSSQAFDVRNRMFSFGRNCIIEPNKNPQIGRLKRCNIKTRNSGNNPDFMNAIIGGVAAAAVGGAALNALG